MGLLIFIGIFLFCAVMAQSRQDTDSYVSYTGKKEKTWCPPHKWEYVNGFLKCSECKRTPEYSVRN